VQTAEAAWRLFIDRGYDNVTVADICTAADIAPRTFHRYFGTKEDVVAEPVRRMAGIVSDYLASAPPATPDAEVMRLAMLELGCFAVEQRDWLAALRVVVQQSHHLQASHIGVRPEQEQEITAMLAARHPEAPADWRLRLLVAYSVAVFRIWYDDHSRAGLADPLGRLEEMLRTVTAGLPAASHY
jgi:AcrR family transcriptional regulator